MNNQEKLFIQALKNILPTTESLLTNLEKDTPWGKDWTQGYTPNPLAVAFPKTTKQVSEVLRLCYENKWPVVPNGGRTGLAAGAVASNRELVISLEKMSRIINFDKTSLQVEVEAGVILETLQDEAQKNGLLFPIDLAAKGSCQIGGNIATNAGGLKLIRYDGMREKVLGVEVVTGTGEILDLNFGVRKNNSGYDLKQLFIGSEGTLGIITKATLKLSPRPGDFKVACLGVSSFKEILHIFQLTHDSKLSVSAFEFFTGQAHQAVLDCKGKDGGQLFDQSFPFYLVIEVEEQSESQGLDTFLEQIFEKGWVEDGRISSSSEEFKELWGWRENISESIETKGFVKKNDISVPVSKLADFYQDLENQLAKSSKHMEIILFGHIGDGNIHLNYTSSHFKKYDDFAEVARKVEEKVFSLVQKYRGSISAEHGIGLLKKGDLHYTRTKEEISYMRQIKKIFDPHGILNPGKIFDL